MTSALALSLFDHRLPRGSRDRFPALLSRLEAAKVTFGMSATTLEEVFLQVAHASKPVATQAGPRLSTAAAVADSSVVVDVSDDGHAAKRVDVELALTTGVGTGKLVLQVWAFIVKRALGLRRSASMATFSIVAPAAFVCLAVVVMLSLEGTAWSPQSPVPLAVYDSVPDGVAVGTTPYAVVGGPAVWPDHAQRIIDSVPDAAALHFANVRSAGACDASWLTCDSLYFRSILHVVDSLAFHSIVVMMLQVPDVAAWLEAKPLSQVVQSGLTLASSSADNARTAAINVTMHYNASLPHALPSYFHAVMEGIVVNASGARVQRVTAWSRPLPQSNAPVNANGGMFVAILLAIALSCFASAPVTMLTQERVDNVRFLMLSSGVSKRVRR